MAQWRLCGSAYRGYPSEASLHSQYYIHISSPSTTDNEGGGWLGTGPIGYPSGFAFSSYVEADNRQQRAVNRGLISDEYFFFLQGDRLWRADFTTTQDYAVDGFVGNTWSTVHTFTNMEAGRTGRNTGIYPTIINVSGVAERYIVGAYNSTVAGANTWKGFRYNVDTGATSETSSIDLSFAATPNQGGVKAEIFHQERLYFIGATDGGVGVYNPQQNTLYKMSWPTTDIRGPHDFCVFNGTLYCLNSAEYGAGGGSGIYIWRLDRGQPELVLDLAQSGFRTFSSASEQYEGRCVLFTDKQYLYAGTLCYNGTSNATRFFVMGAGPTGTLTWEGMNPGTTYGDNAGAWQVRLNAFVEQNTNPDSEQQIILNIDQHGATGCYRHQWVWNGPFDSATEENSTQGLALHELRETARSHCKVGGGERIFVPSYGGPRADITNFTYGTSAGKLLVTYEIFNNPYDFHAGTPCTVQLRYDSSGCMPFTRCTLASPSAGTLSENNTVIQIAASASGTPYTFEWDYDADGFSMTDIPNIALFISTTGTA